MNKRIWFLIIFGLFVTIFVILFLSTFGIRKRVDIVQTRGDQLYRIWGDKKVGQTFVANKDNLNIIILDLKNPALGNQQSIYFRLIEIETGRTLREIEISGLNVGDPSSVRFQFEPIRDSAGKNYCFYLNSPLSTVKDAIEVYYSPKDIYAGGEMIVSDQEITGELRFTSYYYPGSKITAIRETVRDFFLRFLSDRSFVFIYLILLFLILGLSLAI